MVLLGLSIGCGFSLRLEFLFALLLLLDLLLAQRFLTSAQFSCVRLAQSHDAALLGERGGSDSLPVGFLHEVHMHDACLDDKGSLARRFNGLSLLRYHSASILRAKGDVLIHPLVLLLEQALPVVPCVVRLEEEVQLFLLDLLGQVFSVLLVRILQQLRVVLVLRADSIPDRGLYHLVRRVLLLLLLVIVLLLLVLRRVQLALMRSRGGMVLLL